MQLFDDVVALTLHVIALAAVALVAMEDGVVGVQDASWGVPFRANVEALKTLHRPQKKQNNNNNNTIIITIIAIIIVIIGIAIMVTITMENASRSKARLPLRPLGRGAVTPPTVSGIADFPGCFNSIKGNQIQLTRYLKTILRR